MSAENSYGRLLTESFGIKPKAPPPPTALQQIGDGLVRAIPRVGQAIGIINAGPVQDGTLDHARRMGWMR